MFISVDITFRQNDLQMIPSLDGCALFVLVFSLDGALHNPSHVM